jgi:hypothetical protein
LEKYDLSAHIWESAMSTVCGNCLPFLVVDGPFEHDNALAECGSDSDALPSIGHLSDTALPEMKSLAQTDAADALPAIGSPLDREQKHVVHGDLPSFPFEQMLPGMCNDEDDLPLSCV